VVVVLQQLRVDDAVAVVWDLELVDEVV